MGDQLIAASTQRHLDNDAVRLVRQVACSEEPEVGKYLRGCVDQIGGGLDSFGGLGGAGSVG